MAISYPHNFFYHQPTLFYRFVNYQLCRVYRHPLNLIYLFSNQSGPATKTIFRTMNGSQARSIWPRLLQLKSHGMVFEFQGRKAITKDVSKLRLRRVTTLIDIQLLLLSRMRTDIFAADLNVSLIMISNGLSSSAVRWISYDLSSLAMRFLVRGKQGGDELI